MTTPFLLLIEDDADDAFLALREFRRHDHELSVRVIAHGPDAVGYLRKSQDVPALILLDYKLTGVDAPAILQELRSRRDMQKVPVLVMLSGQAEYERLDETLCLAGATACVQKPLRYAEIAEHLEAGISA